MNNLEAMAKMVEEETQAKAKPQGDQGGEQPAAFTEERAAEMIESAVQKATGETAEKLAGFTETLAAIQKQLETLKPKGEEENA